MDKGPATNLDAVTSYLAGSLFIVLTFLCCWLAWRASKNTKRINQDFLDKYNKLSAIDKGLFTKEEYRSKNISWWNRHQFLCWVLLAVFCAAVALTFFIGHAFTNIL